VAAALVFAVIIIVVVCSAFVPAPSSAARGTYEVIVQDEIRLDPGADYWWIPFDVVGSQRPKACRLISVTIDGADMMDAVDSATAVLVNELHLPMQQFADWSGLRSAVSRSVEEQSRLDALNTLIENELAGKSHSSLRLSPSKLGAVTDRIYSLTVTHSRWTRPRSASSPLSPPEHFLAIHSGFRRRSTSTALGQTESSLQRSTC
jgi:hypothetical protein